MEGKDFSNFGRGPFKEHFYEIILKSSLWPKRSSRLKVFLFLALVVIFFKWSGFSNFGRGSP